MNKRQRGRGRKSSGGHNPNRSLDSNGPDVKIRGSANTIYDKYTTLARDAASSGHRVKAENYLQHAEHYLRLVMAQQAKAAADAEAKQLARQQQAGNQGNDQSEPQQQSKSDDQNQSNGRTRRYPSRRRSKPQNEPADAGANPSEGKNGSKDPVAKDQEGSKKVKSKKSEAAPVKSKQVGAKSDKVPDDGLTPAAE